VLLLGIHPSRAGVVQECSVLVRVCLWGWLRVIRLPMVHQPRPGMSTSGNEKVKKDKKRLRGGAGAEGTG